MNLKKILLSILAVIAGLFLVTVTTTSTAYARDVSEVVGLDSNSAVIKDSTGKVYSHTAELPDNLNYTANYQWSIPNGVNVSSGDTLTFHLPENVIIPNDATFPMKNSLGITIGMVTITQGSQVGVVVLNSALTYTPLNRKGYIRIIVTPNVSDSNEQLSQVVLNKTASWAETNNPNTINWQVNVLAQGSSITNPTFVDKMSPNHTYIDGSAKLVDSSGFSIPIEVTRIDDGLQVVATGDFVGDLTLTYQSITNLPTGAGTYDNTVTLSDSQGHSENADASISRQEVEPGNNETPGTTEPGTSEPGSTETPGTTEPGTQEPNTETPSTEQPSTSEPGSTETPGTTEPGTTGPGTQEPNTENPGTEQPNTSEPDNNTEPPSTDQPEVSESDNTETSGTGITESETQESDTENPVIKQPNTQEISNGSLTTEETNKENTNNQPSTNNYPSIIDKSDSSKFPQTGNSNESVLTIIGLILLATIVNVIVLVRRRIR